MLVTEWSAKDVANLLSRPGRGKAKPSGRGWKVCCPAHDDRTPSLQLDDGTAGLIWHCFGGCDSRSVFDSLRAVLSGQNAPTPLTRTERKVKPKAEDDPFTQITPVPDTVAVSIDDFYHFEYGSPANVWTYRNADGSLYGWVCRYNMKDGHKEIIPWLWGHDRAKGKDMFRMKGFPEPRPLYNLHRIAASADAPQMPPILYNEGEKDADASGALFPNWIPTTPQGGSKAWHKSDHSPLRGRLVIRAPDNDGPGYDMALEMEQLYGIPVRDLRILRFPTHVRPRNGVLVPEPYVIGDGWGAADHVREGWTHGLLKEAVKTSPHPLVDTVRKLGTPFEPIDFED